MTDDPSQNVESAPALSGEADNRWYFTDDQPGVGERPDYLDPRYKSLAEQARAYKELEKRFSAVGAAPEDYDLGSFNEYKEDPTIQELLAYSKDNKMSQEGVGKFFAAFDKLVPAPDLEAERAKLGPNADEIIDKVSKWSSNNLSAKANETIKGISMRAEVVEMLNEIRMAQGRSVSQPPHGDANITATAIKSYAEVAKEVETEIAAIMKKEGEYNSRSPAAKQLRAKLQEAYDYENRGR